MLIDLLILLIIAVFILSRLWGILGIRPDQSSTSKTVILSPKDVVIEKQPNKDPDALYPGFDEQDFLDGAEKACQKILKAYYDGDLKTLAELVEPKLVDEKFKEKPEEAPSASCLVRAEIIQKSKKGRIALITVRFAVQQIFPSGTVETDDSWTFRRKLETKKKNWMLCAVDPIQAETEKATAHNKKGSDKGAPPDS